MATGGHDRNGRVSLAHHPHEGVTPSAQTLGDPNFHIDCPLIPKIPETMSKTKVHSQCTLNVTLFDRESGFGSEGYWSRISPSVTPRFSFNRLH
jgi:hypothetical protein